mmetsp:Transcript_16677/g.39262  ORF Transcript_16677/g.39262 Transcript_16677/m.39262 type:complete len:103 (-) Transcript_16677:82-390(-)
MSPSRSRSSKRSFSSTRSAAAAMPRQEIGALLMVLSANPRGAAKLKKSQQRVCYKQAVVGGDIVTSCAFMLAAMERERERDREREREQENREEQVEVYFGPL